MNKSVIIIGGGLAGLASAVFLSKEGFNVNLFESLPKLGGRTYSYYDKAQQRFIDNGQHILAGWYEYTFEYLKLIGTYDYLHQPERMKLIYFNKEKSLLKFENGSLPGFYGLLSGIFKFKGFNLKDKISFLNIRKVLNGKKISEENINGLGAEELLNQLNQTDNLKSFFWNPLIYAAFNTVPENVSADLFIKLLKKGTKLRKNMSLILTERNLNEIFIDKAIEYLNKNSANVYLNTGVKKINIEGNNVINIETNDGKTFNADFYIAAVPNYSIKKLFVNEEDSNYFSEAEKLKSSAIISVHLFFKDSLNLNVKEKMFGLVDSVVQWVFIKDDKHICLVISGSDFLSGNLTERENNEIYNLCVKDLKNTLNGFDENNIKGFKIIKEKKATFLPEPGSEKFRFKQKTKFNNLFVAGDWTDTGYPSMIEGAIKSARICKDLILVK